MNLNILYLYPNMMDLYGDGGNIDIIKYRAKKRNIDINLDTYTINDDAPNFCDYDLVFLGGGPDKEQKVVAEDLIQYKDEIRKSLDSGVFYLLICGGFQLFGKYYKDAEDNLIEGLNIFNYYTESSTNKKERCIGNIILETKLNDKKVTLLGFENHGGQTYDVNSSLGRVTYGNGNTFNNEFEGFMQENVIGTYLHGPLLSKNPELADYIIKYMLERKYNKEITLEELDDEFERLAKKEMVDKLLNS